MERNGDATNGDFGCSRPTRALAAAALTSASWLDGVASPTECTQWHCGQPGGHSLPCFSRGQSDTSPEHDSIATTMAPERPDT